MAFVATALPGALTGTFVDPSGLFDEETPAVRPAMLSLMGLILICFCLTLSLGFDAWLGGCEGIPAAFSVLE